jgi:hypothetical protein
MLDQFSPEGEFEIRPVSRQETDEEKKKKEEESLLEESVKYPSGWGTE